MLLKDSAKHGQCNSRLKCRCPLPFANFRFIRHAQQWGNCTDGQRTSLPTALQYISGRSLAYKFVDFFPPYISSVDSQCKVIPNQSKNAQLKAINVYSLNLLCKPLIILVPLTESIRFSLLQFDNIIPMRAAFAACNNMLRDKVCKLVIVFVKICVVYGVQLHNA